MSTQSRLVLLLSLALCASLLAGSMMSAARACQWVPDVTDAETILLLALAAVCIGIGAATVLVKIAIKTALEPIPGIEAELALAGADDVAVRPGITRGLTQVRERIAGLLARLADLDRQNAELKAQIVDAQATERAELGRDLHDDVAPLLFGIEADAALAIHHLSKGAKSETQASVESIAQGARHLHHRVRDVLRRLAPGGLLELGLAGAIEHLVALWKKRFPHCAFVTTLSGGQLDPGLEATAFRVVQESVSNAMRHGAPSVVDVSIDIGRDNAKVVVKDDGIGFPGGSTQFGFGLSGLQERVRAAGGTASVRNRTTERGVIVEVLLPLRTTYLGGPASGLRATA